MTTGEQQVNESEMGTAQEVEANTAWLSFTEEGNKAIRCEWLHLQPIEKSVAGVRTCCRLIVSPSTGAAPIRNRLQTDLAGEDAETKGDSCCCVLLAAPVCLAALSAQRLACRCSWHGSSPLRGYKRVSCRQVIFASAHPPPRPGPPGRHIPPSMVLEATIIIVDNSEHSRNGDYVPSRFEAQIDAVNLIFSAKTQANPESSVGLMSMGGAQPEVLTTLTTDHGKVIDGLHRTKIKGRSNFSVALNVAGLALKHRQNKSQHQRIIVFTCSPIAENEKDFVKLAKRMKKNTIAVDIVAFGDLDSDTTKKVGAFHDAIKGSADGSHLAIIQPGPNLLSDSIVATDILAGDGAHYGNQDSSGGGGDHGGSGGGGGGFDFGIDPQADPELALALRMSMEEEEKRRQREEEAKAKAESKTSLEAVAEDGEGSSAAADGAASKDDNNKDKKDGPGAGDSMDTS
ncbi:hypothetical protein FH972_024267 [Carpinus fangiana]|uniref:26S proteasome non-ATPase regulatory subunit 4 homolog n=1 Tax=Carpinus fangiana TaxID=176857 RepID=A0A5N6KXZ8_9ROSI|nr:hypothetical protein FH972_024267 [Carpinus fangiana]